MSELDLRPLSLGEILDRTFSLYRRHFLLFVGITAIPHLLILAMNLTQLVFLTTRGTHKGGGVAQFPGGTNSLAAFGAGFFIVIFVYGLAFLISQGATIYAVSELYLGRQTTIGASLRRVWGQLLNLLSIAILNGLCVIAGAFALLVGAIYVACRLITAVPAALLEDLSPGQALQRSWNLTRDYVGRAFLIYVLYSAILYGVTIFFALPFSVVLFLYAKDPAMVRLATGLMDIGTFFAGAVVGPFLLIATSVYYYDLRVRKEAFDLQMMMHPDGNIPTGESIVPSMFA
jgi:Membrane domain of glycerophosphoryl diester phosphodiesterase